MKNSVPHNQTILPRMFQYYTMTLRLIGAQWAISGAVAKTQLGRIGGELIVIRLARCC